MKEPKLIDRVVVEIKDAVCDDCPNEFVATKLREIADLIESGIKGGDIAKSEDFTHEVLWEHEMQRYGGFRIVSDKSLISQYYYGSEPKPNILPDGEHVVASINKQDLIDFGFDGYSILDDDIASVASRMGKAYHEGYCDCWGEDLRSAAEYIGLKEKED